jgi:hypothetical protein
MVRGELNCNIRDVVLTPTERAFTAWSSTSFFSEQKTFGEQGRIRPSDA